MAPGAPTEGTILATGALAATEIQQWVQEALDDKDANYPGHMTNVVDSHALVPEDAERRQQNRLLAEKHKKRKDKETCRPSGLRPAAGANESVVGIVRLHGAGRGLAGSERRCHREDRGGGSRGGNRREGVAAGHGAGFDPCSALRLHGRPCGVGCCPWGPSDRRGDRPRGRGGGAYGPDGDGGDDGGGGGGNCPSDHDGDGGSGRGGKVRPHDRDRDDGGGRGGGAYPGDHDGGGDTSLGSCDEGRGGGGNGNARFGNRDGDSGDGGWIRTHIGVDDGRGDFDRGGGARVGAVDEAGSIQSGGACPGGGIGDGSAGVGRSDLYPRLG
nr:glycine-rich protein DOT1-like [Setaria viridis]